MSNQVYRDQQAAAPYSGEVFLIAPVLTGTPGGSQTAISATLRRITPTQAQLSTFVVSGPVWNSATSVSSAAGAIPVSYRPTQDQTFPIVWINGPPTTLFYPGVLQVSTTGTFTLRMIGDFVGGTKVIPDLSFPASCTFTWTIA